VIFLSFFKLYKAELIKTLKKPIFLILLAALGLPLFYGISVYFDISFVDISGEGMPAVFFMSGSWSLLQLLMIPQTLFMLIASNNFSGELEKGQIKNLLVRGIKRNNVVLSKCLVNATFVVGFYLLFCLFSVIAYYAFIVTTALGSGDFTGGIVPLELILSDIIYILNILVLSNVVFLLGLYFNPSKSFILGIFVMLGFIFMQYFPYLKIFSPMHIATQIRMMTFPIGGGIIVILIYILLMSVPIAFLTKRFDKIDMI
jgi:ABC-type transport system involved in multi-copper enzyme maturation permease subunit